MSLVITETCPGEWHIYLYSFFPMLKKKAGLQVKESWSKNKLTTIALIKVNFKFACHFVQLDKFPFNCNDCTNVEVNEFEYCCIKALSEKILHSPYCGLFILVLFGHFS